MRPALSKLRKLRKNLRIIESRKLKLFFLEKISDGTEVSGCFPITGLAGLKHFQVILYDQWEHNKRHVFVDFFSVYRQKMSFQIAVTVKISHFGIEPAF